MDSRKKGKIQMRDFENLCEEFHVLKRNFSGLNNLQQNSLPRYLWTHGQRPYWELWRRRQGQLMNFDMFKISLLGCWAAKYDFSPARHSITYDKCSVTTTITRKLEVPKTF